MYGFVSATQSNGANRTITIGAGQSVIVVAQDGGGANSTLALSDGTNIYVQRGTKSDTRDDITTTLFDCLSPTPGTYTLTLSGQVGNGACNVILYTGLSAYSAASFESFFAGATPPTSTDGCTTSAITPTSYAAMIFGAAQTSATTVLAAGTGFTSRYANDVGGDGADGVYVEDLRLTSGSNIASFTMTAGGSDVTVIGAAYLESGGGGAGAALAGSASDTTSATAALTAPAAPFAPIVLNSASHTGGSTQLNMGTGPNTGTGDPANVAFPKIIQDMADLNTMMAQLFPVRSYQVPVTGFTLAPAAGITQLVLNPAGTLAAGTVTLPANPGDQQPFALMTSQAITALTVDTSDGTTLNGPPTTLAANAGAKWRFVASPNAWFREQ